MEPPVQTKDSSAVLHMPSLCVFHTGEPGIFFSCDLTHIIACGQDRSKDCCTSLLFLLVTVSALSLWYKWAPKHSYTRV